MMFSTRKRTERLVSVVLGVLVAGVIAAAWLALRPMRPALLPVPPPPPASAMPEAASPPPAPAPTAPQVAAASETPAPTLPFKLRGIIYAIEGDSVIFLQVGKTDRICRTGETVEGWKLVKIERSSARFSRDGQEVGISIEGIRYEGGPLIATGPESPAPAGDAPTLKPGRLGDRFNRTAASKPPTPSPPPMTPPPLPAGAKTVDGTVMVAARDAERLRDEVEKVWKENPAAVLGGAIQGVRAEPNMVQGQMRGFVLRNVPVGSLAAQYNFSPGDRITAVNGQVIDSPARAMEIYRGLGNVKAVTVTVEREGRTRDLLFYIP